MLRVEQNAALNPYANGLPDSVQQELAERYAELFGVFLKHPREVERVTFWGVTDGDSWLNDWPVRGRTNYPLLFDRDGQAQAGIRRGDSSGVGVEDALSQREPGPSGLRSPSFRTRTNPSRIRPSRRAASRPTAPAL